MNGKHLAGGLHLRLLPCALLLLGACTDPIEELLDEVADALSARIEAESLQLTGSAVLAVNRSTASGGKEVAFYTNGSATGTFSGTASLLQVRARGSQCNGSPIAKVIIDGAQVLAATVPSTNPTTFSAQLNVGPGVHRLEVRFDNDTARNGCDRNLYVDYLALELSGTPPPPPVDAGTPPPPPPPADAGTPPPPPPPGDAFVINHDATRGRIRLENAALSLEFGYKVEAPTHGNQSGGNLYRYVDKRFSTQNLIAVWEGGSSTTKAYASGAGGIGSTQIYAVPDLASVSGASYRYALADNAADGALRSAPVIQTLPDGAVKLVFDVAVSNRDWAPSYEWYTVLKTWTLSPQGRLSLRQDWRISRAGYFSEPAIRNQVSTVFKTVSRWGHTWSNTVAGAPGTNSRLNPANRWYHWVPNPASVQECNAPDGSGGSQDAVHADFNRFHGGPSFDFWFWPDNGGLGFEGLGQYRLGYEAFGQSSNATINELCHHNRTTVGDGADAYNLGTMAWWGGDGATSDRFKPLPAGKTWTDSYQMEARPTGEAFPVSFSTEPPPPPPPPPPPDTDTVFTLVVIPDTQRETNYYPARFDNRMQWLASNKTALDIRFVLQVGDLVDWDTPDHIQYVRASNGLKLLENASMPYAFAVGNHDTGAVCPGGSACPGVSASVTVRDTTTVNSFFPPSRFKAIGGTFEAGKMDNAFHTFKAGGLDWLVLNLELWPRAGAVTWAKGVVAAHPKHNVIMVTHSYLSSSGGIEQSNGGYGANSPQYVYDNFLKLYPNVRLVFAGHTGTTAYRVDTGTSGNKLYSFLQTYHDMNTNPTRLLEIDTANGTIKTRVFSPFTGEQKNDGSAFSVTGISWVK